MKTKKTKNVTVTLNVNVPKRMKPARVAQLLQMCIDIGMNDAGETLEDPELDNVEDAEDAVLLNIEKMEAVDTP
jgi:hypothetical protein